MKQIEGVKDPQFKGFYDLHEAHKACRELIGINYFVSPSIPPTDNNTAPIQYNIASDTEKVIFCGHCSEMDKSLSYVQEQLRRKDHDLGILYKENGSLTDKLALLKKENEALRENLKAQDFPILNTLKNTNEGSSSIQSLDSLATRQLQIEFFKK